MFTHTTPPSIEHKGRKALTAAALITTIALAGCGGNNTPQPAQPSVPATISDLLHAEGMEGNLPGYIDKLYASDGCLENTPYDPIPTDGGTPALVHNSDTYARLSVIGTHEPSDLIFNMLGGKLIPSYYTTTRETMQDTYACELV